MSNADLIDKTVMGAWSHALTLLHLRTVMILDVSPWKKGLSGKWSARWTLDASGVHVGVNLECERLPARWSLKANTANLTLEGASKSLEEAALQALCGLLAALERQRRQG